ncbi:MAG: glycosyltransferase family 4 protein [Nitrospinae bacterium]|nr:glycosyltransferase family 4 protein [Nitrospinota bacterium]
MHILIICHAYLLRANRKKLDALSEIDDVKLSLIVPERWTDYIRDIPGVENGGDERYKIYPLPVFFQGYEAKYFYKSFTLLLNGIRPDIIFVEQGSYALSYFQTIIYKKIFSQKSKIGYFTWVNIPYELNSIMKAVERYDFRNSDFAVAGNRDAEEILRMRGFDRPIKILPQLGIDPEIFKKNDSSLLKEKLGLEGFVIGYVGRLHTEKGIHLILTACDKIKDERFSILIVGGGEEKENLLIQAEKLNLSRKLSIVDTVPIERVADYINCMDTLVLSSISHHRWREQFGHVLIEAMACEVPVIGSTCGEIANVIGDGGLIFSENDEDGLYRHITFLLKNPEIGIILGKKGRERVLSHFTHQRIAKELVEFFKDIL